LSLKDAVCALVQAYAAQLVDRVAVTIVLADPLVCLAAQFLHGVPRQAIDDGVGPPQA
jgi:hypothetical protein